MTTYEYLSQVGRLGITIENKLETLKRLDLLACSCGAVNYDKDIVQTTHEPDKIGKAVAKIIDMENEIDEVVSDYLDRRNTIEAQIENLENQNHYNILYRKFFLGYTLEKIATDTSFSLSQTKRNYHSALETFEKMYGEMYLNERFDLYFKKSNQNDTKRTLNA